METKIIAQKENLLFKRKEILIEVTSNTNPTKQEILKILAEKFSVPEENIKLNGIYGNFGTSVFSVYANIYDSIADKDSTEIKTKKEKEAEKKAEADRIKSEAEEKKKIAEESAKAKEEAEKPAEENKTEEIKEENKSDRAAE